jgi:hypothetical protein
LLAVTMKDAVPDEPVQGASHGHDGDTGGKRVIELGRLLMLGSLMIVSFRFIAIPFIILLSMRGRRRRFHPRQVIAACLLALALLSPVDVGVPGLGHVCGQAQSGVRLLHVIRGLPSHTALVARYGEYVSTGCAGLPCLYQPTYWVVWW